MEGDSRRKTVPLFKRTFFKKKYYSAIKKNMFESVLMRWMKLEPNIQN